MKTRAEMEQIIIQGGSVSIGGRVISRVQDLPSETSLATNDPKALKAVIKDIDKQITVLQKQRKQAEQALKDAGGGDAAPPSGTEPPSGEAT